MLRKNAPTDILRITFAAAFMKNNVNNILQKKARFFLAS